MINGKEAEEKCVFISGARPWERSGGCRAEVEQRLGGAATPACSPSEPQSRTSSRGAQLCSAERSKRVNTHSGGVYFFVHYKGKLSQVNSGLIN